MRVLRQCHHICETSSTKRQSAHFSTTTSPSSLSQLYHIFVSMFLNYIYIYVVIHICCVCMPNMMWIYGHLYTEHQYGRVAKLVFIFAHDNTWILPDVYICCVVWSEEIIPFGLCAFVCAKTSFLILGWKVSWLDYSCV